MAYLAKKKCRFAGVDYYIGQTIPDGVVHETAAPRLKGMGVIADAGDMGLLPPGPADTPTPDPASIVNDSPALTIDELMKYTKAELLEQAEKMGLDTSDMADETKKVIAQAILEAAGEE